MLIFMKDERKLLTGGEAAAYAAMQIDPEVCAAYPITPQTPIIETFAKYVSDGKVSSSFILVESEHSAMSAIVGASAFGARTFTASSSQGLLYMNEVIYAASGLRLPIVMVVGNRAISAPINIHTDHSDSFSLRDSGWIQIYCEDVQEVYDSIIMAQKIAEKTLLPVMVMQDGFYTTHSLQPIYVLENGDVKDFIGEKPKRDNLYDDKITFGEFALQDVYFETRIQLANALRDSKKVIEEIQNDFSDKFGRDYSFYDALELEDAEYVFIALNSVSQVIKQAVSEFRKKGIKVGMLRPRIYRPFYFDELKEILKDKKIVVLERVGNYGAEFGPMALEFKGLGKEIYNVIFGLGGRDFNFDDAMKVLEMFVKNKQPKFQYYGENKDLLSDNDE